MFILIYILFSKVVSHFQVFEPKFADICYFLIRPTWPASPSWFVAQDYKLQSLPPPPPPPPPQRMHVCFTKCSKTTIYWENASTCTTNRGKQSVLWTPLVTYLHFYAYFTVRTDIHQEIKIIYWPLVLCFHLWTLTTVTDSMVQSLS